MDWECAEVKIMEMNSFAEFIPAPELTQTFR